MHIEKRFPGELRLCHRQWTKNPAETTGKSYKNVNLVTRTQKWMGSVGCFGQIENIKRQSLLKAFYPGWDDRYGFYLDDGKIYVYRSGFILSRFTLKEQEDETYRISNYQVPENVNDDIALDEAMYSLQFRWDLISGEK